jgi:heavy metal translocating P-type ATPase
MACADDCHSEAPAEAPRLLHTREILSSLAGWAFVVAALVTSALGASGIATILYAVGIVAAGFIFAREAVEGLRERKIGIELLMTVAIAGAAALGQWREAALVAGLYSISEALESYTIRRTRHAIRGLMALVPPTARVLRAGGERKVPVEEVQVGERVLVRPGEAIPVDGVLREGSSAIDESAVTGESMPVDRQPGAEVFAGTVNGNGALVVEATRPAEDNTVHRIIALVEKAQAQKGRAQLLVERFGRIYSPAVLGVAILLAVVPLLVGGDAAWWAERAVSFLVAASPCALAVATPVTLVAAIGSAARRGVLIKGGVVLETLGRTRAMALDKTGTLTHGRPEVTDTLALDGDESSLLRTAAAVEQFSEHPLGRAIVEAARARGETLPGARHFSAVTGAGVTAEVEGAQVAVLKPEAARARGLQVPQAAEAWQAEMQAAGRSVVMVLSGERLLGLVALGDTVRPEAPGLLNSLRAAGVEHVVMLTGDNLGTAKAIAAQTGITEVIAGLLPEQKVAHVSALRAKYGDVVMVGDGINDAPALAAASVGIAMGTGGSDAALAAADVALVGDDLSKLHEVILLGRRARRVILQNITAALVIVGVLVAGTFLADLSMFAAVVGHEGSEVFIILNGMRVALRR